MAEARLALHDLLGVTDGDVPVLRDLFCEAVSSLGMDGSRLFDRMEEGASLGEALALPTGVAALLYAHAYQWFSVGRVDRAEPLFHALCVLDGTVADHWVGQGICLRMRQQWAVAERALNTAAGLRPDWDVPYFHLMELYIRLQDWPRAKSALAAFEARAGDATPEPMRHEARRFSVALASK
jgi:tetratricopeptide (TPR) repeat protein